MKPVAVSSSVPSIRLPTQSASPRKATGGESFQSMVEGLVNKVNQPQVEADQALQQLATGQTENVHGVVLAMVKADMSFRMALEVRNRLTEAYQEIMRMQI